MKLPKSVWSQLGPITVTVEAGLASKEKEPSFGLWDAIQRTIKIDSEACMAAQIQTLMHETVHVALWDSGTQLTSEQEEAICDAVGVYLAGAILNGFLTIREPR